jgi:uncharacterized protein YjbJ (UPF0337 family)
MGSTEGKFDDAKGRVKQAAGDLADDRSLKNEGTADRASGSLKDKVGDAKDKVEDAIDAVKDKVTGDRDRS